MLPTCYCVLLSPTRSPHFCSCFSRWGGSEWNFDRGVEVKPIQFWKRIKYVSKKISQNNKEQIFQGKQLVHVHWELFKYLSNLFLRGVPWVSVGTLWAKDIPTYFLYICLFCSSISDISSLKSRLMACLVWYTYGKEPEFGASHNIVTSASTWVQTSKTMVKYNVYIREVCFFFYYDYKVKVSF